MADSKLSALTPFTTPQATDELYANDGGVSKKITYANLEAAIASTANVTAAGALMDSEVTNLAAVKAFDPTDYATAAQGSTADSALQNVVEDTTPQLGGSLDVNGQKIVSASNGNIDIEPNGTGNVLLGNFTFDADQAVGAGQDNHVLTYDNGTGLISLEAAAAGAPGGSTNDIQYNNAGSFGGSYLKQGTNTIEQRNSTNAQTFNIYNTYTDASNYERGFLKWNSNVLYIGTESAGTGSNRSVLLRASDADSGFGVSNKIAYVQIDGNSAVSFESGNLSVASTGQYFWSSGASASAGRDTGLQRSAAGVVKVTDGSTGNGALTASYLQTAQAYTVATLPGTPAVGMIARVTDANAPAVGSTVAGSGAAAALVWYNGSNWTVIGV